MTSKPTFISSIVKIIYYIFAHIPLRIIANIIFYIAISSVFLHFISFYIEKHPDRLEEFIEEALLVNINFTAIKVNYNLLNPTINLIQPRIFKSKQDKIDFLQETNNKEKSLHFKSASISFNLFKSIIFFQPYIKYINLDGLNATITQNIDNSFSVGTVDAISIFRFRLPENNTNESTQIPLWLLRLKSISTTNTRLTLNDEINNIKNYQLNGFHFKFTNQSDWKHTISLSTKNNQNLSASTPIVFDQINFIADFKGSIYKLKQWTGSFYLNINNLEYQNNKKLSLLFKKYSDINLIKSKSSIKLWGDFSQSSISQLVGHLELNETKIANHNNKKQLKIDNFSSFFKLNENKHFLKSSQNTSQQLKNWLISLYHLKFEQNLTNVENSINYKNLISLPHIHFNILKIASKFKIKSYIEKFELSGWDNILYLSNSEFYQAYQQIKPQGKINNFRSNVLVENKQIKDYQINVTTDTLSVNAWKRIPKFSNLSAQLWVNNKIGFLDINSSNFGIELKPEFKHPWKFIKLISEISWQNIASQKWINIDFNSIENDHLKINGNAQLWSNLEHNTKVKNTNIKIENQSPLLLISANFNDINASHVPTYLPTTFFGKALYDWLNSAFISAKVPDGGVIYSGRLNKFPYADNNGIMEITFHTKDLLLNYHHGWPLFKNISSEIQFTETGMFVDVDNLQLYNSSSHSTQVKLDNYLTDDIKIRSIINANASDAFKYLGKTELLSSNLIKQLKSKGKINIDLSLTIPEDEAKPIIPIIQTQLIDLDFSPQWLSPHHIKNINGQFKLNKGELSSNKIIGRLNNETLIVAIKKNLKENDTLVDIDGTISTKTIKTSSFIPKFLSGLFTKVEGKTKFNTLLTLSDIDGRIYPHIEIKSDLVGIQSELPKPFNKEIDIKKILNLSIKDNNHLNFIELNYSNQLTYCSGRMLSKNRELKVSINFSEQKCNLPKVPSILLSGKLDLSHYKQWQKILTKDEAIAKEDKKSEPTLNQDPLFREITFNFEETRLPKYFLSPKSNDVKSANKEQQKSTEITGSKLENLSNKNNSIFTHIPLNGTIKNLIIGDNRIGTLTIKSHPEEDRIKFDRIKFIGDHTLINIQGSTYPEKDKLGNTLSDFNAMPYSKDKILMTEMQGKVLIKDLGGLLKKLNISEDLQKTDTELTGNLKWRGSLSSFSKNKLEGKMNFKSKKGYIKSIKPGLGRIISIFNLSDVQRRLDLNFSDVSENGFNFNSMEGELIFDKQILSTKDIDIDSNIAQINVNGTINLDTKICKHKFTIIPDISTGLPYAGLALAGPIGLAVGFLSQKVIGSEINKISEYNFKVNGPCSDPEVEEQAVNIKDSGKSIFDIEQSN